jgi:GTP-binding protein HflX
MAVMLGMPVAFVLEVEAVLVTHRLVAAGLLGLHAAVVDGPVEALNKIDRVSAQDMAVLREQGVREPDSVLVSAATGAGCAELVDLIERRLRSGFRCVEVHVPLAEGAAMAWLYERGHVMDRHDDESHAHLRVNLDPADIDRFRHRYGGEVWIER